jgi:hypothetical protein
MSSRTLNLVLLTVILVATISLVVAWHRIFTF